MILSSTSPQSDLFGLDIESAPEPVQRFADQFAQDPLAGAEPLVGDDGQPQSPTAMIEFVGPAGEVRPNATSPPDDVVDVTPEPVQTEPTTTPSAEPVEPESVTVEIVRQEPEDLTEVARRNWERNREAKRRRIRMMSRDYLRATDDEITTAESLAAATKEHKDAASRRKDLAAELRRLRGEFQDEYDEPAEQDEDEDGDMVDDPTDLADEPDDEANATVTAMTATESTADAPVAGQASPEPSKAPATAVTKASKGAPKKKTRPAVQQTIPPDQDSEWWRSVPTLELALHTIAGIGEKKRAAFYEMIPTMGELEDARAEASKKFKPFNSVLPRGIGRDTADEIESAFLNWLSRNRDRLGEPETSKVETNNANATNDQEATKNSQPEPQLSKLPRIRVKELAADSSLDTRGFQNAQIWETGRKVRREEPLESLDDACPWLQGPNQDDWLLGWLHEDKISRMKGDEIQSPESPYAIEPATAEIP